MLLQFLNYAQHLEFEIEYLGGVAYRKVIFKVRDGTIKFENPMVPSTNHYQLEKIKNFFQQFHTGLFITSFDNTYFPSLLAIPQVRLNKCPKQKYLIGKV